MTKAMLEAHLTRLMAANNRLKDELREALTVRSTSETERRIQALENDLATANSDRDDALEEVIKIQKELDRIQSRLGEVADEMAERGLILPTPYAKLRWIESGVRLVG